MQIKICCIQSPEEAKLAVSLGANALGFVSRQLNPNRCLDDEKIREIARATPPSVATVLLTPSSDPLEVKRHQQVTRANTIQLVGPINRESVLELRGMLPDIRLLKVIHVEDSTSIDTALHFSEAAHALLLDTKVKARDGGVALGGTGVTHDWSLSRRIVEQSAVPVILAGGLSPKNVRAATQAVRPFGVDVCSGLRPNGVLDSQCLRAFVRELAT